ncbi:50S ribosomal protein L25 [Candidatus Nomurabacteria bacterium]|nr:50S ribosomal protein L25 [Candidatus Nomurabacteria bacterium]
MDFALQVQSRTDEPQSVRATGSIPGIIYGPEREKPVSIQVDYNTFDKLYEAAGSSNLLDLTIDSDQPVVALIKDIQHDPIKNQITHFDLYQVKMGEMMNAETELNFVGVAPAVKSLGGTLSTSMETLNIRCLPKDLVGSIDVDLSVLATFDDGIAIKDLNIPEGIEVLDNPDALVATVLAPLTQEQLDKMDESQIGSVEDVAVEEKGKEDGEEGDNAGEKKAE